MRKAICPLISVIVPVYKVEKYISRCIDSIINQTYTNLEIIIVDDGSPDCSGEICDEYARNDSRIKVIHQKNQGLVGARQAAIKLATGKYLAFVDSDDYIHLEMLECMSNLAESEQLDITWCNVEVILREGERRLHKVSFNNDARVMVHRLLNGQIQGWTCNKLIRTDYWRNCNLICDIKYCMLEDMLTSLQILCQKPKMGYVDNYFYYYDRTNDDAYTSDKELVNPLAKATGNAEHMYEYLVNNNLWNIYKVDFARFAMRIKLALLSAIDIDVARRFMPFAHKKITYYGLNNSIVMIYWMGFNGGKLGKWVFESYLKLKNVNF